MKKYIIFAIIILASIFFMYFLLNKQEKTKKNIETNKSINVDNRGVCLKVKDSIEEGKNYFLEATKKALSRIEKDQYPAQVDLYTLIHYIIFEDDLNISSDAEEDKILKEKIANYFLENFGNKVWDYEGCLPSKILYGLEKSGLKEKNKAQFNEINKFYADLIANEWSNKGVGECFSGNISRTYAMDFMSQGAEINGLPYSCEENVDHEITAKLFNYLAIAQDDPINSYYSDLNKNVVNESIDLEVFNAEEAEFGMVEEQMWNAFLYLNSKNKFFNDTKIKENKTYVSNILNNVNKDENNKTSFGPLLYAYLIYNETVDPLVIDLVEKLIEQQRPDGSFSAFVSEDNGYFRINREHDIYATPTYYALLPFIEFNKLYCD